MDDFIDELGLMSFVKWWKEHGANLEAIGVSEKVAGEIWAAGMESYINNLQILSGRFKGLTDGPIIPIIHEESLSGFGNVGPKAEED